MTPPPVGLLYYALAATLLTAPEKDPAPRWGTDPAVMAMIQDLAVGLELIDKRETKYILDNVLNYDKDLLVLRDRFAELHDAPLVSDVSRFPNRDYCNDAINFNRHYLQYITGKKGAWRYLDEEIKEVEKETEGLYAPWDRLRDATAEVYYIQVRKKALKELRKMIGDEAFSAGRMPPFVPVQRFSSLD
jgi:hypothetical protein